MHTDHNNAAPMSVETCEEANSQVFCRVSYLSQDTLLPVLISPVETRSLAEYRDVVGRMISTYLSTIGGVLFRGFRSNQ